MDGPITKQDILDLLARQAKQFDEDLRRNREEVHKELQERQHLLEESQRMFDEKLAKSQEKSEKANERFEAWLEKSNRDFNRRLKEATKEIGGIGRTLGNFAEAAVMPRILELFEARARGIHVESSYQHIKRRNKQNQLKYEIDLFLANGKYVVAVEVKIEVSKKDVDKHLERLAKIHEDSPKSFDLSEVSLLGGIAGTILDEGIANYAMKKGLFVISQSGDNIKIDNDQKFQPKEWKFGDATKKKESTH